MGDERMKQFDYAATSNLVLSNRGGRRQGGASQDTGEVGRVTAGSLGGRMGDRLKSDSAQGAKPAAASETKPNTSKRSRADADTDVVDTVDTVNGDVELGYRPRTKAARMGYEQILTFVTSKLGDQPRDVLRAAAEECLAILKNDRFKDVERNKEIGEMLGHRLNEQEFGRLSTFARSITDYQTDDEPDTGLEDVDVEQGDGELDQEMGVAVVFDADDEDEDDGESNANEVVDTAEVEEEGEETAMDTALEEKPEENDMKTSRNEDELDPHSIDAHWLQRQLAGHYQDAEESRRVSALAFGILGDTGLDTRAAENKLVALLKFDKFDLIKTLLKNRETIVYCVRFAIAQGDQERAEVEAEMLDHPKGREVLEKLSGSEKKKGPPQTIQPSGDESRYKKRPKPSEKPVEEIDLLDLDDLSFHQGNHLMSNRDCHFPKGSLRVQKKDYEEVHIPAIVADPNSETTLVPISDLPEWSRPAFGNTRSLNRVQSAVFSAAFESDENLLLCAPTGAGKTNVAVLSILRVLSNHLLPDGSIDLRGFKIVYIAPMKALVTEVVGNLGKRLQQLGVKVGELTGDISMSRQEIAETQIIVTTPEKWDVITRKSGERTFTQFVCLLIVDEIHLLHDDRGPVLESVISRSTRASESSVSHCRIVGLSATLPNYRDVAAFLRVKLDTGLFHFDGSFRPCPLQQQYIGISTKKALRRFQLMNEVTYEKVKEQVVSGGSSSQVIVFVHSRKETATTANFLRDSALGDNTLDSFMKPDSASHEIIRTELDGLMNSDLKDLLVHGFGIHHAGMSRSDRIFVEDLFADGHIKVLVSTATLAWGVNLPAHAVIIKGTQVYIPEKGGWSELSPMDVMQMMGRAGRPQFDTHGEGIIITTHGELQFYLSLLNQQLPIESQLVGKLPDSLNAEIALGTVSNLEDASAWLGFTYLYIRMLRHPTLYGMRRDAVDEDPTLRRRRKQLVHSAATILDRTGLIRYDRKSGKLWATDLGIVASNYYIGHKSMAIYADNLNPNIRDIDLLRLFALSSEFSHVRVREEEKLELVRLGERVPIPVKDGITEPAAKVSILLQSFISQLSLDGLALMSDMVYVTQSAGRLLRALFEIVLRHRWASLTMLCLNLSKMVSHRMWGSQNPLRQFGKKISSDALVKLERKDIDFERYYHMTPPEIGELLRDPKLGRTVHRLVHYLPRLDVAIHVQPITRSTLRIELTLAPDFRFDKQIHGAGEMFWIFVEDADGETILFSDQFYLRARFANEDHLHLISFIVPIVEPLPPQYFVRVSSDRWIAPDTIIPISFRHLILPSQFRPYTKLYDMELLPSEGSFSEHLSSPSAKETAMVASSYFVNQFEKFNAVQTQAFGSLVGASDNCFIGAPAGSGLSVCAELAMVRLYALRPTASAVFLAGASASERFNDQVAKAKAKEFENGLGKALGLVVGTLSGEVAFDTKLLDTPGVLVVATPEKWDMLSRRWKQRRAVRQVGLFVVDNIHLVGGSGGPVIEVCVSRMRYIAEQLTAAGKQDVCRIIALSYSAPNARDLSDWIGVDKPHCYSFSLGVRPVPLDLHIQAIAVTGESTVVSMARPIDNAIRKHAKDSGSQAVIFVSSRKFARATALELVASTAAVKENGLWKVDDASVHDMISRVKTTVLRECLLNGVAYLHGNLAQLDHAIALELFEAGAIKVLVTTSDHASLCQSLRAQLVIIAGTSEEDSSYAFRQAEYSPPRMMQLVGRAGQIGRDNSATCLVLTSPSKKEFYRSLLSESTPIESHLDHVLSDQLNAEIVSRVIESKQDAVDYVTWTFFYRRLAENPHYYNMVGSTNRHVSDHLSELIETSLAALEACKCVAAEGEDDMALGPLNLGMIASYYYIKYTTVELFASSIHEKTKLRGLLDVLAAATEYDQVPIRVGDEDSLGTLARHLPINLSSANDGGAVRYADPHIKTHLLLQSHFSRNVVAGDLGEDRQLVVRGAVGYLQAMVDVISSSGWLKPALAAMELNQMIVQSVWDRDSSLIQLPHITADTASALEDAGVEGIFDLIDLDDDRRRELLGLSDREMADVAEACNRYPNIELGFELEAGGEGTEVQGGDAIVCHVALDREVIEGRLAESTVPMVHCPLFPESKRENWWLVVGDTSENLVVSVKRVALKQKARVKLEFNAPEDFSGRKEYKLYFMCDSYLGCDQEEDFAVDISESKTKAE